MSQTKTQLVNVQSIGVGNGTAAAPALTGTDTDTGISFGTNEVLISTNGAEKAKIDASGYLRLASGGIQFNGDTGAVNALNDYEEGTWTPVFASNGVVFSGATYALQNGHYIKVGKQVFYRCRVTLSNKGTVGLGHISVLGLPYTSISGANNFQAGSVGYSANWISFAPNNCLVVPSSNAVYLYVNGGADARSDVSGIINEVCVGNASGVILAGTYYAD